MVEFQIRLPVRSYYTFHLSIASAAASSLPQNMNNESRKLQLQTIAHLRRNTLLPSEFDVDVNDPMVNLNFRFVLLFLQSYPVFLACIYCLYGNK